MRQTDTTRGLDTAICSYDVQSLRVLGKYLLEYGGFRSCTAYCSGKELLHALANGQHYDIVILEEHLQDMDAARFLQDCRQLSLSDRPITVLLAAGGYWRARKQVPAGTDQCFLEPISLETVARQLQAIYNGKEGGDAGRIARFCARLCHTWGVQGEPASLAYLADACALLIQTNEHLAIRKEILMAVGEKRGVSVAAVDSGLRRLIDRMEEANTPAYCQFKEAQGLCGQRPTIGRLLYALRAYWHSGAGESGSERGQRGETSNGAGA